jgi:hypothetical protein
VEDVKKYFWEGVFFWEDVKKYLWEGVYLGCQEVFQSSSFKPKLGRGRSPSRKRRHWAGGRSPLACAETGLKAAVSNRNWAVAGAHLASADTGPEAGAHTLAPKLGRRPEPSSPAPPSILHRSSRWTAGSHSRKNKNRRQPPGSPNPSDSADDPHPRRTPSESAGRNPMRAAPPRALAPAPRNHPPQRRQPYQIPTPRLLPSLPPFPTAAAIQHPAAEEGYRASVELLAGGRVRLARGSFKEFITGAWRSAAPAGPASCGMPPLLLRVAVGGRHRRLARCSVEDVITGRCVWIWAFGDSYSNKHLGMHFAFGDSYSNKHFGIWGFVFEQAFWHLGIWGFVFEQAF